MPGSSPGPELGGAADDKEQQGSRLTVGWVSFTQRFQESLIKEYTLNHI